MVRYFFQQMIHRVVKSKRNRIVGVEVMEKACVPYKIYTTGKAKGLENELQELQRRCRESEQSSYLKSAERTLLRAKSLTGGPVEKEIEREELADILSRHSEWISV
jgi:hypothetical protein